MALYSAREQSQPNSEMNITPLVDVMLVLLVIFMVTAPAVTQTMGMRLPTPGPDQPPPPKTSLHVRADGQYQLDGRLLDAKALPAALDAIARRDPDTVITISSAGDSDYQVFATALSATQNSGLSKVALQ